MPATQSLGPATMRIGFRTVDGVRIRYAESKGPDDPTIVLTSPWPESVYAFAPVWSALANKFRLFAVDLPGFGASEQPSDLLSPKAIGTFLVRLIEECDLGRPHIVGPDVGTSAACGARRARDRYVWRWDGPSPITPPSAASARLRRPRSKCKPSAAQPSPSCQIYPWGRVRRACYRLASRRPLGVSGGS
jgi:pimeloyl-ACP methyl ester carboxylesterase